MSASFYERVFARVYDTTMAAAEARELGPRRARLLNKLAGNVLEIGCGTGVNLGFYGPAARVLACEPSAPMLDRARRKLSAGPPPARVELLEAGVHDAALERRIAAGSLDAVVATLVLCTLPEPARALERFAAWLRPGGKLILLEHIRSKGALRGALQDALAPFWSRAAGGCRLNQKTDLMLDESIWRLESREYFAMSLSFFEAVYARR